MITIFHFPPLLTHNSLHYSSFIAQNESFEPYLFWYNCLSRPHTHHILTSPVTCNHLTAEINPQSYSLSLIIVLIRLSSPQPLTMPSFLPGYDYYEEDGERYTLEPCPTCGEMIATHLMSLHDDSCCPSEVSDSDIE